MHIVLLAAALAGLLPAGANVVEVQPVARDRTLVLWMFVKSTQCPDY